MKPSFGNCYQRGKQHGQAMVEFVVAATFFLIPLFLGLVAIGKFSDVQHTTTMAARYVAWERTVWYDGAGTLFDKYNGANHKTAAQIDREIAMRLFNDRSQATSIIKDTDKGATTFANGIDPLWHDNSGVPYLDNFDQLNIAIKKEKLETDITGTALALIKAVPLPSDTLAVSTVRLVRVADDSAAYKRLWPKDSVWMVDWVGLDFNATSAILSNTWYANGADSTKRMVEELVPMAKGPGKAAVSAVSAGMKLWDPTGESPEWGKIAPDVVPPDRLK